jgi:hypothetical protein
MKKFIAALIFLFGEGLIIATMLLLHLGLEQNVLILDIIVLSIIWGLISYDTILPLGLEDTENKKEIGHLGVRWHGQLLYAFAAILMGILGGIFAWPWVYQLLIQASCFAILIFTFLFAHYTHNAIQSTTSQNQTMINSREQMKIAIKNVQNALFETNNATESIKNSINDIENQLRFISPSDKAEAKEYEEQFIRLANDLTIAFSHIDTDTTKIEQNILRLQRILIQRKQVLN